MSPSKTLPTVVAAQVIKELGLSHKGKHKVGDGRWQEGDAPVSEVYESEADGILVIAVNPKAAEGPSSTILDYRDNGNGYVKHVIDGVLENKRASKTIEG